MCKWRAAHQEMAGSVGVALNHAKSDAVCHNMEELSVRTGDRLTV